ncbi:MAG TPA: hypothetical protein VMB81_09295, partial [Candidatus Sulfotelmatobacter sp.]|nr:hypothetical protein [Candidatus Sulfotelmatobacter sp.]
MFDQSIFERSRHLAGTDAPAHSGRLYAAARALLVAIPLLWSIAYFFPPLNHDVAALLQFAQRMLHGERLYVDLIDINPPMIFLLDTIPIGLAEAARLPTVACEIGFVLALAVLGLAASTALLRRLGEGGRPLDGLLWPALIGFALLVYPMHSFGQREHLLLIFALPYALVAAARADGAMVSRGVALATALAALPGIALKPHFALVPLALELLVLTRVGARRWLASPQPWLILAGLVAYVAMVRLWFPEYLTVVVPLAARNYEQLAPTHLLDLAIRGDQVPALVVPLIPLAVIAWRLPAARLSRAMVALTLAATGAGLLQGKGWDYQFLAARGALVLTFGAVIADGFAQLSATRPGLGSATMQRAASVAIAAATVAGLFAFTGVLNPPFKGPRNFANTAAAHLLPIVEANATGRPVLWLTTSIYPQFPVLNYTDSKLAMPFMSLWVLPAVYGPADLQTTPAGRTLAYHAPAAMGHAERMVWRGVIDGFTHDHPALVLVVPAS